MSAYVTINGVYPYQPYTYVQATETVRIVEETVDEYFDEDGKLTSRTTKTVTRYEKQPQYQIWNEGISSKPIITN